jgi:spermidine synthase
MKPWVILDRAVAADGVELVLAQRDREHVIRANGKVLMSSRAHTSETVFAKETLKRVRSKDPGATGAVLIGGLGMGFTVRSALDALPSDARVVVLELVPAVIAWNRTALASLAGNPLSDARVRVECGDVTAFIAKARGAFDAILLDIDNGPSALAHPANASAYDLAGLCACRAALRPHGVLGVWSAGLDRAFESRLADAEFTFETERVPAGPGSGGRHVLYLAK